MKVQTENWLVVIVKNTKQIQYEKITTKVRVRCTPRDRRIPLI